MTIGNRVIELLSQKGLKQKDLAEYLGTGTSTINGWKKENRNPSSDMILPICEFLDVDCEFLLSGQHKKTNEIFSKEDSEWLTLLHQLPPEKRLEFKGELKGYIRRLDEEANGSEPLRKAK